MPETFEWQLYEALVSWDEGRLISSFRAWKLWMDVGILKRGCFLLLAGFGRENAVSL